MYFEPLIPGCLYHIYNRGINKGALFMEPENYELFLDRYKKYCTGVFNTFAYNLLGNHFHLVVQVKPEIALKAGEGKSLNPSQQLGHLFNAYAQTFNRKYHRTGGLFKSPFHRKQISTDSYFSTAILYTHRNAIRHGFVQQIESWPHSSYRELLGENETFLSRQLMFDWFGGREQFIEFHQQKLACELDADWMEPDD